MFLLVEAVAGVLTGSLALLADAGHMLADVSSLLMALVANWFTGRAACHKRSYGWHRLEIMAAFLNGLALIVVSVYIAVEAVHRFSTPRQVNGGVLLIVAVAGLVANIASALVLYRSSNDNLNVKAAFLHVLADMLGSVGAILAGVLIVLFGWMIADPIIGVVISILVLVSAWNLVRECVAILMQSTPEHVDAETLTEDILGITGVTQVHDLHVWTMTSGYLVLTVHVVVRDDASGDEVLHHINEMFHGKWGIRHTTVQIEWSSREHKEPGGHKPH